MQKISERIIIDNGYKRVYQSEFQNESGKIMNFITLGDALTSGDNVVMLIFTAGGHIILNREFRFGPEEYVIGVPTGNIEKDESMEETVIREVREETGYDVTGVIPLGQFIDNTFTRAKNHYVLALCQSLENTSREEFEDITNIQATPTELEKMLHDGTIQCCFTPAIYFLAKAKTNNFTTF